MKNIVLVGGGSGLSDVLPVFLRSHHFQTTTIVSTFDSGGSTGKLRRQFSIPAVGDLRHLLSASQPKAIADLLEARTKDGHAVGNLFFAFFVQQQGFEKTCKQLLPPHIVPVSFGAADIKINCTKKKALTGEHHLDTPPASYKEARVDSLALTKKIQLNPAVTKILRTADVIVVGPGSLLGSLLPHFLVTDFVAHFEKAKATKILIAPRRAEWGYRGETVPEMAARFPVVFDYILQKKGARWDGKELLKEIKKLAA